MSRLPFAPKRRWMLVAGIACCAAVGGVYALNAKPSRTDAAKVADKPVLIELLPAEVLAATPRANIRSIAISGSLNPVNQIQLNATFEGRMSEVRSRPGDEVAAGQVLALFDESDLRARIAERTAALASAEEQMRVAERNRNSSRTLLDQNFISKNAFDNTLGGYAERQAAVDAQRAQLAILQRAQRDARIVAPFAGAIASRQVEPGQWVEPNRKLFTLIDLKHLEVEAAIPSQHLAELKIGQQVRFHTEGYGDERFEGRLTRINPSAQAGTRSVLAYVAVENPDKRLRAGLFVSGEIEVGATEQVIRLPATAIQVRKEGRGLWLVRDGKLAWQPIEFTQVSADEIQVLRGLNGGEQVVAMALKGATEGLAVRLKPAV